MNYTERQVLWNTTRLVTSLNQVNLSLEKNSYPHCRNPLPKFENGQFYPPDEEIIHNFVFYVLRGGIDYARSTSLLIQKQRDSETQQRKQFDRPLHGVD